MVLNHLCIIGRIFDFVAGAFIVAGDGAAVWAELYSGAEDAVLDPEQREALDRFYEASTAWAVEDRHGAGETGAGAESADVAAATSDEDVDDDEVPEMN